MHLIESPCLNGFGKQQMARLGTRKQQPALTCELLYTLETWLFYQMLPRPELVILGGFLLYVSLRARQGDLDSLSSLEIWHGRILARVVQTKTSGKIGDRLPIYLLGP